MKYVSLGSGSRGNSTLVCASEGSGCILIDCGFSRRVVLERFERVGFDAAHLSCVFITHEHVDHVKGVVALCDKLNVPFYCSFGTAKKIKALEHPLWRRIHSSQRVDIGALSVIPVAVPHDALEPLQFVINQDDIRLGILSDIGTITPHVLKAYRHCHGLQVEANHDIQRLQQGPYPPSLKRRVMSDYGHLNNDQCIEFLQRMMWHGLERISVGHISEQNNDVVELERSLRSTFECLEHHVQLLTQDTPSAWIELRPNQAANQNINPIGATHEKANLVVFG